MHAWSSSAHRLGRCVFLIPFFHWGLIASVKSIVHWILLRAQGKGEPFITAFVDALQEALAVIDVAGVSAIVSSPRPILVWQNYHENG